MTELTVEQKVNYYGKKIVERDTNELGLLIQPEEHEFITIRNLLSECPLGATLHIEYTRKIK